MIYLVIYLLAVFIFVFIDAMLCGVCRRRFTFWPSFNSSMIFPISASIVIWYMIGATKDFQEAEGYFGDDDE